MPEKKSNQNFRLTVFLLLLLTILFTVQNYFLFKKLEGIFFIDSFMHFTKSLLTYDYGKSGLWPAVFFQSTYPPLVYLISSLFYLGAGPSLTTAFWSQLPFWLILTFSLYGIGAYLFSPRVGVLSALFYLTSPLLLLSAPCYLLDAPAAAMLALCFYLLLRSDNFQNRFYSLAFGFFLGLGMMVKWWVGYNLLILLSVYAIYYYFGFLKSRLFQLVGLGIVGSGWILLNSKRWLGLDTQIYKPDLLFSTFGYNLFIGIIIWLFFRLLVPAASSRGKTGEDRKKPFLNLLDAGFIASLLCGWLYFSHYFAIFGGYYLNYFAPGGPEITAVSWLANFLSNLRSSGREFALVTSYPYFWFFLGTGLTVFLFRFRKEKLNLLLPAAFFSSLFLVCLADVRDGRFFLGWLVFAAPLAVFWIEYLKKWKIPVICLLIVSCLYSVLAGLVIPASFIRRHSILSFPAGGKNSLLLERQNAGQLEKFDPAETAVEVKIALGFQGRTLSREMERIYRRPLKLLFQSCNRPFYPPTPQPAACMTSLDFKRQKFLDSLPKKGEAVLCFELPPSSWLPEFPPRQTSQTLRLNDYRYILTADLPWKPPHSLFRRLKAHGWSDAEQSDLNFTFISSYREGNLEYRLLKINSRFIIVP